MKLESNLEKMITEDFATKSCTAVEQLLRTLNKTLEASELHALAYDGQESHAQVV
jgi:hypothetical protein